MKGKFITIEGVDMAGKSTHLEKLVTKLALDDYKVKVMHFPNYESETGKIIKSYLDGKTKIDAKYIQMLYVIDQAFVSNKIKQYLKDDYIVLSDRYDLSTCVYYSSLTKNDKNFNFIFNELQGYDFLRPDATICLYLDENNKARRKNLDLYENDTNLMNTVNNYYKNITNYLCNVYDNRELVLVNTSQEIKKAEKEIYDFVKSII